jgi:hypothetical protein
MKKLTIAVVAALLAVTVLAAPAEAKRDSGWGCGGACRILR